jgi:hypothetical protein
METNVGNTPASDHPVNESHADMAENYKHIKGWGIDADPENEPTYPMKNYNGDDHKRSGYTRPPLQQTDVEVLHSNERPGLSAVFGTISPPSGLSGIIRRFAFKYSEESLKHWFALVLADRVNVIEGMVMDLVKGKIPNIIAERGLQSEWKHNKSGLLKKAVVGAVSLAIVLFFMGSVNAKRKHAV